MMQQSHCRIALLALFLGFAQIALAQNIRSVDVKSASPSDISKAQKAMQEAGLSPQDAANLARQRGATEQQIRDFENRLRETNGAGGYDTARQVTEYETEDIPDLKRSDRKAGFETSSRIFGSYLFNNRNLTFEPSVNVQTPKNYEIGIGDQIIINIWGNSQNNYQLPVNPNGQILIPDVGPVFVAGMTFEAAESRIKQRLTSIYADMGGSNPQTFAQINMGKLRSIKVNIVGEVTVPGTYTLPATATVFNALYLSGGPNPIGSFRNIKVIRNNKIVKTIDIYKFLVDANPSDNVLLENEDILLVPPAEKMVEVTGEFKRTGFFELREGEMLNELIRFAGGFTQNTYLNKTQIYRKTQEGLQINDIAFAELASTPLVNGDQIKNEQILGIFKNRVTIQGAVYRPGEYEWHEGLTLYDLISKADSLLPEAFQPRGIITRYNPDWTTTTVAFSVGDIISRNSNIVLQREDVVLIKSHLDMTEMRYFTVGGEVLHPGQFAYSDATTLADAIFLAGGFTEAADSTQIEVARRLSSGESAQLSDTLVHIYIFDLSRDLQLNQKNAAFALKPFDRVSVRRAPGFRENATVYITGEVKYAGAYAVSNKNQRIADLISLAGGITPQGFVEGAALTRTSSELGVERVAVNLAEILKNPNSGSNLYLRDGDKLHIPEFMQTVKVSGRVQNPFSVTWQKGQNLKYYINNSGGYSSDALKRKVYVKYANGTTATVRSFIGKSYPEVRPGSEIIVPQKPPKEPADAGRWLSIASVLSSLTVALAAIVR